MAKAQRKSAKVDPKLPFEAAIERLEALVAQLEEGELDLEASLEAFEEGVALSKLCASQLESAERRIEVLTADDGTHAFEASPDDGADPDEDED